MPRSTLTIVLYLLLVFASGAVVGAFGYRMAVVAPVAAKMEPPKPTPDEWRREYMHQMQSRLNLTTEQASKLNAILDQTRSRFHDARAAHDQQMKTIREEQINKVRAMLAPEQLPEYEKYRAEREQRAKQAEKKGQ